MKMGKILNGVLIFAAVSLLGLFALSVRIRPTADNVAVLRTTGMTCGSCSTTIEKVLLAKKGVASVEFDVRGGTVVVGYDSKKTAPDELVSTLTGAGHGGGVERVLTIEQFRAMTGRYPGQGMTAKKDCGCGTIR